jgi:hypothetical protein
MYSLRFLLFLILFTVSPSVFIYAVEPDAEIRLYSRICTVRDDKLSEIDSIIIQINNRNGEKYCDVGISFDKSDPLSRFNAWISDTSGNIFREIKKQDYRDENEIDENSLYQDDFIRKFTLKHNVYPYCIGYTYQSVSRQFLSVSRWAPVRDTDIPTRTARLQVQCPAGYPVHVFERNISPGIQVNSDGYISMTWNASYDGSVKKEVFCPPLTNFLPFVVVIPLRFTYGISGSTKSWQSFGEWQYNLNLGLDELPLAEKEKISALTSSIKDKKEIIKILYHYLQDNTRYVNVSLGIGGMKPYPAEYVSKNKYGDCKALTNYMKAILKFAGIESYYATIFAGGQPGEMIADIPGQQFNHVILAVPMDNDTLWLENTSNTNPFGYSGTFTQNRKALLVDGSKSRLVNTPPLTEKDVQISTRAEFLIDFEGNSNTNLKCIYRGDKFETYNSLYTQYNHDIQNTYVHDHIPFPLFEMKNWTITKKDRDERSIVLNADISVKHVIKSIGSERYFSILPTEIPDFTQPKSRKLPVQLPYPLCMTDTLIYHLPFTGKVTCPDSITREGKYGEYHVRFRCEGNTITVYRNFVLHSGKISLAEYSDFYSFLASVRSDEKRKILIQIL